MKRAPKRMVTAIFWIAALAGQWVEARKGIRSAP
jgi:hypothetical protein